MTPLFLPARRGALLAVAVAGVLVLGEIARWRSWLGSWPETQQHVGVGFVLALPVVIGVALLGSRRGWVPVCLAAVAASTPGLIPWSANVVYHRDVERPFASVVSALVVAALAAYGAWGSVGPASGYLRNRLRSAILRA